MVTWNGTGAAAAGHIVESVPDNVGGAFDKAGESGLAATTHQVIANGPDGPLSGAPLMAPIAPIVSPHRRVCARTRSSMFGNAV